MEKTINYDQLVKRNKQISKLKQNGFIIIPKKKFKVVGWACVGLGIITLPIPFTTPTFIFIGLLLLGLSKQELIEKIRHKIFMFKYKTPHIFK